MTVEELRAMIAANMKRREKLHERYLHASPGERRDKLEAELQKLARKHMDLSRELMQTSAG